MSGSLKDLIKTLHGVFASVSAKSSTQDIDRALQLYIEKHTPSTESDRAKLNHELVQLYKKDISASKIASFLSALQILKHNYIIEAEFCLEWWDLILEPLLSTIENTRQTLKLSRDICMDIVDFGEDDPDFKIRHAAAEAIKRRFFDNFFAAKEAQNTHIAKGLESLLLSFAKRRTLDFFNSIDSYFCDRKYRLPSLALLSDFMRLQTQYIYQIYESPLLNSLLMSLQYDTSTTVVSLAITVLIMVVPHIPNKLPAILDQLFTIFARLLCWHRLRLVQRRMNSLIEVEGSSAQLEETSPAAILENWARVDASFDIAQSSPPRCGQLFTFLYGLYPLNFVAFLRDPAAYSKIATDFLRRDDIDEELITSRSAPLLGRHLLHANFTSLTRESELTDQKRWMQLESSDVVNLCIYLDTTGAEPNHQVTTDARSSKQTPHDLHLEIASDTLSFLDGSSSSPSQNASRVASPAFGPIDRRIKASVNLPSAANQFVQTYHRIGELDLEDSPVQAVIRYQRELLLLQNELNFERHLKQQHIQHIGKLQRSQIADAAVETERQNLYNTTKALKIKVNNLENTLKSLRAEAVTSKSNRAQYEAVLNDRIKRLREDKQTLTASTENLSSSLDQARKDVTNMRSSLGVAEGLALNLKQQLEVLQPEIQATKDVQKNFEHLKSRIREAELQDIQLRMERERVAVAQARAQEMQMRYDAIAAQSSEVSLKAPNKDNVENGQSTEHENIALNRLMSESASLLEDRNKTIKALEEQSQNHARHTSELQGRIYDLQAELESFKISSKHTLEVIQNRPQRPNSAKISPHASTDRLLPRRSSTTSSLVSSNGAHGTRRVEALISASEPHLSTMSVPASPAVSTTTVNIPPGIKSPQRSVDPSPTSTPKKENKVLGGRFRW